MTRHSHAASGNVPSVPRFPPVPVKTGTVTCATSTRSSFLTTRPTELLNLVYVDRRLWGHFPPHQDHISAWTQGKAYARNIQRATDGRRGKQNGPRSRVPQPNSLLCRICEVFVPAILANVTQHNPPIFRDSHILVHSIRGA